MIVKKQGTKFPMDILKEKLQEKIKETKLKMPFAADGFKSEKTPKQPDGVTPIEIEKAGL